MSPAMFGHSSSPQNALLGSATLAPLRWCLIVFGHFGIVVAIWGVGSTCWVQLLTYTYTSKSSDELPFFKLCIKSWRCPVEMCCSAAVGSFFDDLSEVRFSPQRQVHVGCLSSIRSDCLVMISPHFWKSLPPSHRDWEPYTRRTNVTLWDAFCCLSVSHLPWWDMMGYVQSVEHSGLEGMFQY